MLLASDWPFRIFAGYNVVNQLTAFNGQAIVYDANGNVVDDGERVYQWDAENRLIGVAPKAQPDRKTVFRYDGLGRRTAIVAPDGVETRYLWCGAAICQARDSSDLVSRRYYPEGEIGPAGGRLFYAKDHLGSIRDLLSLDDGSRLASFDYDPYGNATQSDGSATSDFRYAGMFFHQASGLYLTQYRAYDPRTGRWLSRDPLDEQGGLNLYAYVSSNPINSTDPLGLSEATGKGEPGSGDFPGQGVACPPHTKLICIPDTPELSKDPALEGLGYHQPDYNFGGLGYAPYWPNKPNSGITKWGRYNCLYQNGGVCSFVGPGNGMDLYGVETKPKGNETVPVCPYNFEVDPDHPSPDLDPSFLDAVKKNYQCIPKPGGGCSAGE